MYGGDEKLYLAFVRGELSGEEQARLITENQCLHAGLVTFDWFGEMRTYAAGPEGWLAEFARGEVV